MECRKPALEAAAGSGEMECRKPALEAAAGSGEMECRKPALEAAAGSTDKNLKTVVWRARRKGAKPALAL
ncbi:hypothetical protein SLEP1_g6480 [Rubroshorea leprosula]|uniref:Uncharacterized protein n=1 Tax=Rubroshorea leprosula TaxID=152421 RepID=A0AAV5I560_9ROSI|nr:hypothetical protein SLEP1_g6480 [Rubroshorea leprosula]